MCCLNCPFSNFLPITVFFIIIIYVHICVQIYVYNRNRTEETNIHAKINIHTRLSKRSTPKWLSFNKND